MRHGQLGRYQRVCGTAKIPCGLCWGSDESGGELDSQVLLSREVDAMGAGHGVGWDTVRMGVGGGVGWRWSWDGWGGRGWSEGYGFYWGGVDGLGWGEWLGLEWGWGG